MVLTSFGLAMLPGHTCGNFTCGNVVINTCGNVVIERLFFLAHILDILRTADINLLFDGMIYAAGSIKFLAANTNLHEEFLEANCVECFVDLLSRVREMVSSLFCLYFEFIYVHSGSVFVKVQVRK